MSGKEVHVGDVGTVFQITVLDEDDDPLNISESSERLIFLRSPNDTVIAFDAYLVNDGYDGKMDCETESDDINVHGRWEIQGKVIIPQGTFYTDVDPFIVEASLQ